MHQKKYRKLIPLEEAFQCWLDKLEALENTPLKIEEIPLNQAFGRTLAFAEPARLSSPAFHGAAMDGIAVQAEDSFGATPQRPLTLTLGKNAFWVNTGRPLPPGCNAVIMSEKVFALQGDEVQIEQAAYPWQHVRKTGEDIVATEVLLPPGTLLGAYELGALAAGGVLNPKVFVKPKVALIPSGSELLGLDEVTPELLAQGHKIPEFNSLMLSAMVRTMGAEPVVLPIVPDEPELIRKALLEAAEQADLVVLIAGSSTGSRDFSAEIVAEHGEIWVHGISLMPGKPTALGRIFGKPFIGAPGYPVSACLAFEEFGQTLLALWQKRGKPERHVALASPFQALPSKPGLEERVRVKLGRVDNQLYAVPLPRGAGTVTSLSRADGIFTIAASSEGLPKDKNYPVTLIRQPGHIDGTLLAIGSHDNALELLDSFLRRHYPPFSLTSAHVGSLGGLLALGRGQCHLAGSHLLDPLTGLYNQAAIQENLPDLPVMLLRLADREQGLILPKGNPQNITKIEDLVGDEVRLINRQRGSGTRVLLDYELARRNISSREIMGYEEEEYTHMNVAVAVLTGRASVGLGVRSAALALNLDFIPVGVEEYDLVIPKRFWSDTRIQATYQLLRSAEFKQAVFDLGGYGVERMGEIVWES